MIQAHAPAHIIESGLSTEAILAQIAISKYAVGLPLYCQSARKIDPSLECAPADGQIG